MHMLAGLITTWLPTRTVPITVQEANGTIQATIGTVGQIHSQRLTKEAGQPMTRQHVGFAVALQSDRQTAELAPSVGTHWADPDRPRPWESRCGGCLHPKRRITGGRRMRHHRSPEGLGPAEHHDV